MEPVHGTNHWVCGVGNGKRDLASAWVESLGIRRMILVDAFRLIERRLPREILVNIISPEYSSEPNACKAMTDLSDRIGRVGDLIDSMGDTGDSCILFDGVTYENYFLPMVCGRLPPDFALGSPVPAGFWSERNFLLAKVSSSINRCLQRGLTSFVLTRANDRLWSLVFSEVPHQIINLT